MWGKKKWGRVGVEGFGWGVEGFGWGVERGLGVES
jgi:hypothetical protein